MSAYLYTDELESELEDLQERENLIEAGEAEENELDDEDRGRMVALTELFDEIGTGLSETLIPESEFADYAEDLASDVFGMDTNAWPANRIDWEDAADDLKVDYNSVEFDGETHYYHA